ncbi:hypothetical protein [Paenibacillus sp. NPDC058174]|uniref:hypothetical protein n=1 Tax=Paenibacillus sp. NPDC058174 TaxID=3346366 RepID=UPI0036DD8B65
MDRKTLFAKYNRGRNEEYEISTLIFSENKIRYVVKSALTEKSEPHIQQIHENTRILTDAYFNVSVLQGELSSNAIRYPYVEGISWDALLFQEVLKKDKDKLFELLTEFSELIYSLQKDQASTFIADKAFIAVFGEVPAFENERCLSPGNIDLIFDNIIVNSTGENIIIDCEWVFPFRVPIRYILFRSLYAFSLKYKHYLLNITDLKEMCELLSIDDKMREVFMRMEEVNFQHFVRGKGNNELSKYSKSVYTINPEIPVVDEFITKIFVPREEGYSEHSSIAQLSEMSLLDKEYKFKISIDQIGETPIRFDPTDRPAIVGIKSIVIYSYNHEKILNVVQIEGEQIKNVFGHNEHIIPLSRQDEYAFIAIDEDPQLFFEGKNLFDQVGDYEVRITMKVNKDISESLKELYLNSEGKSSFQNEIQIFHKMVVDKQELEELKGKYNTLQIELEDKQSELVRVEEELKERTLLLQTKERELNELLNSKSWKITAPLRAMGRARK